MSLLMSQNTVSMTFADCCMQNFFFTGESVCFHIVFSNQIMTWNLFQIVILPPRSTLTQVVEPDRVLFMGQIELFNI